MAFHRDKNYTKRACDERKEAISYARTKQALAAMSDRELTETIGFMTETLSKLHPRFIWKRDRIECKLGQAKAEQYKRAK